LFVEVHKQIVFGSTNRRCQLFVPKAKNSKYFRIKTKSINV
jgi:hypothetical protein